MYVKISLNQLEVPLCLCTLRLFLKIVKSIWKRKTKQVSQQFHLSLIFHKLFMDDLWKSDQQWRITRTESMLTTSKEFQFYRNVRTIAESICEDYLLNFCHAYHYTMTVRAFLLCKITATLKGISQKGTMQTCTPQAIRGRTFLASPVNILQMTNDTQEAC